jgi:hypothetical protein
VTIHLLHALQYPSSMLDYRATPLLAACWILTFLLGLGLAWQLPRRFAFAVFVRRAILGAYLLRVGLALGLLALSILPVESIRASVNAPGLWKAIPDTMGYHQWAFDLSLTELWHLPQGMSVDLYTEALGLTYTVLGPHPLTFILFNPIFDVITLCLALRLGYQVSGAEVPRWVVIGFALWPSWLLWSTQLMRDPMILCGILVVTTLIVEILTSTSIDIRRSRFWIACFLLAGAVGIVAASRGYMIDLVVLALIVTGTLTFVRQRGWRRACVYGGVILMVLTSRTLLKERLVPHRVADPRSYFALGEAFERRGDLRGALYAYDQANSMSGLTHREAFERAARILERQGRMADARAYWTAAEQVAKGLSYPPRRVLADESFTVDVQALLRSLFSPREYLAALTAFGEHFKLGGLQILRTANLRGSSQFDEDADVSTLGGLIRELPSGMLHALFAPFPSMLAGASPLRPASRLLAIAETPWLYAVVVLGLMGFLTAVRSANETATFLGVYALLTVMALAVSVPNDGLLFRYRLPPAVLLALLAPLATRVLTSRFGREPRCDGTSAHSIYS